MSSPLVKDTLRILHLPPSLSNEQRDNLFKKYGAVKTKTVRRSEKYTMTFAKFPSNRAATEAFLRLHQLEVKGQHLLVEFAKKPLLSDIPDEETSFGDDVSKEETKKENPNKAYLQAFLKKLNSWAGSHVFTQPPPPNIWYKYSPPTRKTISRIAVQLLKEPMFYTQVLHLMNRMNLPPPFEELDVEFPMFQEIYDDDRCKDILNIFDTGTENVNGNQSGVEDDEDEESEMESDGETVNRPPEIIPVSTKRKQSQSTKRLKIPKFVNPAKLTIPSSSQKIIKPEDMFESVPREEVKNLKIDLKAVGEKLLDAQSRITDEGTSSTSEMESGFGLMFPIKKTSEQENDGKEKTKETEEEEFISAEQLSNNRISVNDQRVLPVFKNYHPGKPSCRLYIKNLAKQVELKDLHFIYRKFILPDLEDAEYQYDVRLMQEGRMKGQAFITLQNIKQAQLALDETNGYILKDKPMVVQFAKATKS